MADTSNAQRTPEEVTESTERLRLIRYIVTGCTVVLTTLVLTLPLLVIGGMVSKLAGVDTNVGISIRIQLGVGITLTGVGGFVVYKLIRQKRELQKLRADRTKLERELLDCQRQLRAGGGSRV
jgi:hypothetical protein